MNQLTRCGFVAIIGRPNVGKSTLMNHLIGQKISITSRKPQTTRHKVRGVLTLENAQYIFVDTPGFQKQHLSKLNQVLNQSVINSLANVDAILYVVEAGLFNPGDEAVLQLLPTSANVILVINKCDKLKDKQQLRQFSREVAAKYPFKASFNVMAKHDQGLTEVLKSVANYLPSGELLYPIDQLTDKNSRFLASEIIREKLFRALGEELPYSVMVEIDQFKAEAKITKIYATIYVDRENQKPILIGRGGEKLKKISTEARLDMEKLFAVKVHLEVWVKVKHGFAEDVRFLQQFE